MNMLSINSIWMIYFEFIRQFLKAIREINKDKWNAVEKAFCCKDNTEDWLFWMGFFIFKVIIIPYRDYNIMSALVLREFLYNL